MGWGKVLQAHIPCMLQGYGVQGYRRLTMDPEKSSCQRRMCLSIYSLDYMECFFNATEVKLHEIMLKGPSTMSPSPGSTQVMHRSHFALLCTYLFLLISVFQFSNVRSLRAGYLQPLPLYLQCLPLAATQIFVDYVTQK